MLQLLKRTPFLREASLHYVMQNLVSFKTWTRRAPLLPTTIETRILVSLGTSGGPWTNRQRLPFPGTTASTADLALQQQLKTFFSTRERPDTP